MKYRLGNTGDSIITEGVCEGQFPEETTRAYGGRLVAESMDRDTRRRVLALLNWAECMSTEDIEAAVEARLCPLHNERAKVCALLPSVLQYATSFEFDALTITAIVEQSFEPATSDRPVIKGWTVVDGQLGCYLMRDGDWDSGPDLDEDDADWTAFTFTSIAEAFAAAKAARDAQAGRA